MQHTLRHLIISRLSCGDAAVSIGGLGALAEFHDDRPIVSESANGCSTLRTDTGAVRINPIEGCVLLAYETLAGRGGGWTCGIGVLGPRESHAMGKRNRITELGPDQDAIHAEHTSEILFDLGAGLPNADFCIRTGAPELVDALREAAGSHLIHDQPTLLEAIIEAAPVRVVQSRAGRIEVYQPIGRHVTPPGPHTHFLPDLVKRGRTHTANIPIPAELLPLLTIHPRHPLLDMRGGSQKFDLAVFEDFERVLARFGNPEYVAEKARMRAAVLRDNDPRSFTRGKTRLGRLAHRVALRQLVYSDDSQRNLDAWRTLIGR